MTKSKPTGAKSARPVIDRTTKLDEAMLKLCRARREVDCAIGNMVPRTSGDLADRPAVPIWKQQMILGFSLDILEGVHDALDGHPTLGAVIEALTNLKSAMDSDFVESLTKK